MRHVATCKLRELWYNMITSAGVVQLVERLLAKEKATGSSPVARSVFRSVDQEAQASCFFRRCLPIVMALPGGFLPLTSSLAPLPIRG